MDRMRREDELDRRLAELLQMVVQRARGDRAAGRIAVAAQGEALVECVCERLEMANRALVELEQVVLAFRADVGVMH